MTQITQGYAVFLDLAKDYSIEADNSTKRLRLMITSIYEHNLNFVRTGTTNRLKEAYSRGCTKPYTFCDPQRQYNKESESDIKLEFTLADNIVTSANSKHELQLRK